MARLFKNSKKKLAAQARRRPTASSSSGAFSYYASKRSNLPSNTAPESRNANKQAKNKRFDFRQINTSALGQQFTTILLVVVLVACVVSVLQVDNNPRVVILGSASQYALHDTSDYQKSVTKSLRSSLLNSNKITVNTRSVVNDLRRQFPEIYDASLVLPLVGHRPTVYIELTRPALVLRTSNSAVVVDSSGRALTAAGGSANFDSLQLPIVHDESNIQLKVGGVVLSSANVHFVEDVVRQFAFQHLAVDKMVLPAGKEELDVYPRGVKYYARFNLHETDSRQQAGTFFAVRQQLQKQGSTPKQYIDVRLAGRAYYQ